MARRGGRWSRIAVCTVVVLMTGACNVKSLDDAPETADADEIEQLREENRELRAELDDAEAALDHAIALLDEYAASGAPYPGGTVEPSEPDGPSDPDRPSGTNDPPPPDGDLVSVDASGYVLFAATDDTWASVAAMVTNHDQADLFFVEVTFNILDASGVPVATESSYVDVIPAGESVPTQAIITQDLTAALPITLEVSAFAERNSFFASPWIELEIGREVNVDNDDFLTTLSGTITNPGTERVEFVTITCLFLADDGSIMGGTSAYPDTIAPGQIIAWNTVGTEIAAALEAGARDTECRAFATM